MHLAHMHMHSPARPQERPGSAAQPIFPKELNDDWEDILWRLDLILSPFKQAFKAALPDMPDSEPKPKVPMPRPRYCTPRPLAWQRPN